MSGLPSSCDGGHALSHGALLDMLYRIGNMDDALYVNAGRDDVVSIEFAGRNQMLDLGNRHFPRRRHHRIKIARGLSINEVASAVSHPGVHDVHIRENTALHTVAL